MKVNWTSEKKISILTPRCFPHNPLRANHLNHLEFYHHPLRANHLESDYFYFGPKRKIGYILREDLKTNDLL